MVLSGWNKRFVQMLHFHWSLSSLFLTTAGYACIRTEHRETISHQRRRPFLIHNIPPSAFNDGSLSSKYFELFGIFGGLQLGPVGKGGAISANRWHNWSFMILVLYKNISVDQNNLAFYQRRVLPPTAALMLHLLLKLKIFWIRSN